MKFHIYPLLKISLFLYIFIFYYVELFPNESNNRKSKQIIKKVLKTKEEWKKQLTPSQYRILREAGTERPNGKIYKEFNSHKSGSYYCIGCNSKLFTSKEKFDPKCGWPSFFKPSKENNIIYKRDTKTGYLRIEVLCKICNGHLGHVFEGEGFNTPTNKRYCINGTILKFVPDENSKNIKK